MCLQSSFRKCYFCSRNQDQNMFQHMLELKAELELRSQVEGQTDLRTALTQGQTDLESDQEETFQLRLSEIQNFSATGKMNLSYLSI